MKNLKPVKNFEKLDFFQQWCPLCSEWIEAILKTTHSTNNIHQEHYCFCQGDKNLHSRKKWLNAFGRCSCACCTLHSIQIHSYGVTALHFLWPYAISDYRALKPKQLHALTAIVIRSTTETLPPEPQSSNTKKLPLLDKNDTEQEPQLSKRDRTMLIVTRYLS